MKWDFITPEYGDLVRVKTGNIWHYGVFASEDEIIQFGPCPAQRLNLKDSEIEVISTDVDAFLSGGFLEVAVLDKSEKKSRVPAKKAVENARKRLGEKGYNLIYNNCEHFATGCVLGKSFCNQADSVREMFKNFPVLEVYVAKIPGGEKFHKLYPPARQKEVENCANISVKKQKYYVWKLLEYALNKTFGYKLTALDFHKSEKGKWSCDECFFSLSHSDDALAVAVSRKPVGVDIEVVKPLKMQGLENKILSDKERSEYALLSGSEQTDYLITKWTQKESAFKAGEEKNFIPAKIEVEDSVESRKITVGENQYCLSVVSEDISKLRVREIADFTAK